MIDYYENRMNIVLPGAGFLGFYYVGALGVLMQVWPKHPYNKISGSSSGGLVAALVGSGMTMEEIAHSIGVSLERFNENGPLLFKLLHGSIVAFIREVLSYIPERAHKMASGRIAISVTRWSNLDNILATHFESRSDLIDAAVAGSFIPLWSGLIKPSYLGEMAVDGAWSDNVPRLDLDEYDLEKGVRTVVLSPFSGNSDVCPCDGDTGLGLFHAFGLGYYFTWTNLSKITLALIPGSLDCANEMITQGQGDMIKYLIDKNFLRCKQCYYTSATHSAPIAQSDGSGARHGRHTAKACLRCLLLMEKVGNLKVPALLKGTTS